MPDFINFASYATQDERAGNADVSDKLQSWFFDCAALANTRRYAGSHGVRAYLPGGNWTVSRRVRLPNGVKLEGDGPGSTILMPVANPGFQDIGILAPAAYNQEYTNIEGISVFGSREGDVRAVHTNNGTPNQFVGSTFTPNPNKTFTLPVVTTENWAPAGYALFDGTRRVIYDGIWAGALQNCYLATVYGPPLTAGATVEPITTNNVHGVYLPSGGAVSRFQHSEVQHCGAENLFICGNSNCWRFESLWVQHSNRDPILWNGTPQSSSFNDVCAQYPGEQGTEGMFGAVHLRGTSSAAFFQGGISINTLYMELGRIGQPGLWLENIGNVHGVNIDLLGGSNFQGQDCIRIDSAQRNPTLPDHLHSANIALFNIGCSQVGRGRTLLRDNVRNYVTDSGGLMHQTRTEYVTEA